MSPISRKPHDAGSHNQQMTPAVQAAIDAADKRMPAGCTTPDGCRQHGCHGACLPHDMTAEEQIRARVNKICRHHGILNGVLEGDLAAAVTELLAELDGERARSQMFADIVRAIAVVLHGEGWSDTSKLAQEVASLRAELDRLRAERKPLTEGQMLECVHSVLLPTPMGLTRGRGPYEITEPSYYLQTLVRAVERAHGITGD